MNKVFCAFNRSKFMQLVQDIHLGHIYDVGFNIFRYLRFVYKINYYYNKSYHKFSHIF